MQASLSPQLKAEAWRGFAALDDPRASLLDLLEGSRAWRGKGPTLEAWVTRELELWLQAQHPPGPAQVSPTLSPTGQAPSHPAHPSQPCGLQALQSPGLPVVLAVGHLASGLATAPQPVGVTPSLLRATRVPHRCPPTLGLPCPAPGPWPQDATAS